MRRRCRECRCWINSRGLFFDITIVLIHCNQNWRSSRGCRVCDDLVFQPTEGVRYYWVSCSFHDLLQWRLHLFCGFRQLKECLVWLLSPEDVHTIEQGVSAYPLLLWSCLVWSDAALLWAHPARPRGWSCIALLALTSCTVTRYSCYIRLGFWCTSPQKLMSWHEKRFSFCDLLDFWLYLWQLLGIAQTDHCDCAPSSVAWWTLAVYRRQCLFDSCEALRQLVSPCRFVSARPWFYLEVVFDFFDVFHGFKEWLLVRAIQICLGTPCEL